MTDKEILEAMRSMLEAEREHTSRMMDEKLSAALEPVNGRLNALSADVARLNHTIEPQLKIILEGLEGFQERYKRLEKVEAKQEDHGHRIWALEQVAQAK